MEQKIQLTLGIILALFAASLVYSFFISSEGLATNVALIKIDGEISAGGASILGQSGVSSTDIVPELESAEKDNTIKAIVLEINSPGGSPVASEEIAHKVKESSKPTIAVIRETGASGAYWVASATNHIIASRMSITGSIGVLASYLDYAGLLDKYNVTYEQLISGKYKDMGSPFTPLNGDERNLLQSKLDKMHEFFISEVAANRNMSIDKTKSLATGEFFLGSEAVQNGLVDEIGDIDTAKALLKQQFNATDISFVDYSIKPSIFDSLGKLLAQNSFYLGQGIGSSLQTSLNIR